MYNYMFCVQLASFPASLFLARLPTVSKKIGLGPRLVYTFHSKVGVGVISDVGVISV